MKNTTQHTPAPWYVMDGAILSECLNDFGNWHIAKIQKGEVMTSQDQANAHLIAAAPELLEAVKQLHELWPSKEGRERFAALINKATGRA